MHDSLKNTAALSRSTPEATERSTELAVDAIRLSPQQARTRFDPDALRGLVASMRSSGTLEPLLVRYLGRGCFQLVTGARRLRAAQLAGLTQVPARVCAMTDDEASACALSEQLQREDLNPIEETEAMLQLLARRLGRSVAAVVSCLPTAQGLDAAAQQVIDATFAQLGKMSPSRFIATRLPLVRLPEAIRTALRSNRLAYPQARAIVRIKDAAAQARVLQLAVANQLSLAVVRQLARPYVRQGRVALAVPPCARRALKVARQLRRQPLAASVQQRMDALLGEAERLLQPRCATKLD